MYLSSLLHIRLHASLTMEPCVLSLMTAAVCKASNRLMSIPAFVAQNSCIVFSILCHKLSALPSGISSLLLHPMDIIVIYIIRKDILANLTALVYCRCMHLPLLHACAVVNAAKRYWRASMRNQSNSVSIRTTRGPPAPGGTGDFMRHMVC